MTDRAKLMRQLQMAEFALLEIAMYLDTHKTDCDALAFYNKNIKMAADLRKEYVEKYGPLEKIDSVNPRCWEWTNGPWPWEYTAN